MWTPGATVQAKTLLLVFFYLFIATNFLLDAKLTVQTNDHLLSAGRKVLYVAPNGDDNGPGTEAQPLRTIQKARDILRSTSEKGATVFIRGGTYELGSTLVINNNDSGTAALPNLYTAFPGETPILKGSRSVSGFASVGGGLFETDLNAQGLGSVDFKQLFFNRGRQTVARTPNYQAPNFSAGDPWSGNFAFAASDTPSSQSQLKYEAGGLNPSGLTNISDGQVVIFSGPNYWNDAVTTTSINTGNRTIAWSGSTSYTVISGNRFFLQNFRELLDAPKEWYRNRLTKKLTFYPPGGSMSASDEVRIPVVQDLIMLDGVSDLEIKGLTFEEADGHGLRLFNASSVTVRDCLIQNVGRSGISVEYNSYRNTFDNNIITEVGSSGLFVAGQQTDFRTLKASENVIRNNRISRIGRSFRGASGIDLERTIGATVSHNEITETPRGGINVRGNDNLVEYNNLRYLNQETQDTGGIYVFGRSWVFSRGNQLKYNLIRDIGGYGRSGGSWVYPYASHGIYLDDWASGTTVFGNIVARAGDAGFKIHGGRDNIIENNIGVNSKSSSQVALQAISLPDSTYSAMWAELQGLAGNGYDVGLYFSRYPALSSITGNLAQNAVLAGNVIRRNIFYYPTFDTKTYWVRYTSPGVNTIDNNYFWAAGRGMTIHDPEVPSMTWDRWKSELHYDQNSTIADPQFVNPAADDYRLQTDLGGGSGGGGSGGGGGGSGGDGGGSGSGGSGSGGGSGFEPLNLTSVGPKTAPPAVVVNSVSQGASASKAKTTAKKTVPKSTGSKKGGTAVEPGPDNTDLTLETIPSRSGKLGFFERLRQGLLWAWQKSNFLYTEAVSYWLY